MTPARSIGRFLFRLLHTPIYERRLQGIIDQILPHLQPDDQVLDVGCGFGTLGMRIMESRQCPCGVSVTGLEQFRREEEMCPIEYYDGRWIPHLDDAFDVVLLIDVLHHSKIPHRLVDECARVAKRALIIKDHAKEGFLAKQRISVMDWASNVPYRVPCLYRYNTVQEWRSWHRMHGLVIEREISPIKLYPTAMNMVFGGRVQYLAVLRKT
jgi:SAM-dependent methyltransferase